MDWVYLSPHLDDVALSCGGLVWSQVQAGEQVSVLTVCAGDPPLGDVSAFAQSLHVRWNTNARSVEQRRMEDLASCQVMGAAARHLAIPDCIYRRGVETGLPLYPSEESIFGGLHPAEAGTIPELSAMLAEQIPAGACVVSPLALGSHVDHLLTRQAAEKLALPLWYYADYPYVLREMEQLTRLADQGWRPQHFPLVEGSLEAWQQAIAAHASQVSTFWPDLESMRKAVRAYNQSVPGSRLWEPHV